jgi:tight adherence protein C
MDILATLFSSSSGLPLAPIAIALLGIGAGAIVFPMLVARGGRSDLRRRLVLEAPDQQAERQRSRARANVIPQKAARTAQEFYARTDPENVARLRLRLIQAGYMEPGAVGIFFLVRFAALVAAVILAFLMTGLSAEARAQSSFWTFVGIAGVLGYFAPGIALSQRVRAKMREYRNGFPDFMDLMIVCSDAGMSMEASIERVARELGQTYPSLAQNLQLVTIELRAGRALDDALKSLSDRLSLDEVRSFATLLQQSRELGTSLSGALRVFSDEMRHKRMSMAEEKAHALPAKMSVPVTVCILPVVLMVAITPIIVRLTGMD